MIHDFDQLEALLGPARTVAARAVRGGAYGAPQHVVCVTEHERGSGLAEGSMMLPSSYPFTSNIRVLGERGILEYPFSAAPAADGGNIGGVDQAANRLRRATRPAARPARSTCRAPTRGTARPRTCSTGWRRARPPTLGTGEQALAALRLSLAANRSLERGTVETV